MQHDIAIIVGPHCSGKGTLVCLASLERASFSDICFFHFLRPKVAQSCGGAVGTAREC